jgi:hypothetical protein
MFINLEETSIKKESIIAIAKSIIPATNFTPEYYTTCVYLEGFSQPLILSYAEEEERDKIYTDLLAIINE